jgi:ribonuclease BN (tRNA processing enzyme)
MKIIFLGTNGWYGTETGATPCIFIDSKEAYIILDAGNGIYKLDRYITDTKKPIYLFISHLHLDHIFGLHIFPKFSFPQGINIFVPQGMLAPLRSLICHPFAMPPEKFLTKTEILELSEGKQTFPFGLECFKMSHSSLNFGYRFTLEKKIISYTGDTGICENSIPLAKNADILIHECSNEPGYISKSGWGHVNPEEVAHVAIKAHVHQLLLTHFSSDRYPSIKTRKEAEKVAQSIFPNSKAMTDDEMIEL